MPLNVAVVHHPTAIACCRFWSAFSRGALMASSLEQPGRAQSAYSKPWVKLAVRFAVALVALFVLDAIWMQLIAKHILGLDYFAVIEDVQGGSKAAGRPIGLIAYLSMTYGVAVLAHNALEAAQLGFVIYSIFDFTSTYMYHGWTLKVAFLDTIWGTTVFAATGAILDALPR